MLKKILLLLFVLTTIKNNAQTPRYQKSYGDVLIDDAQAITYTTDSGYCMVGGSGANALDSTDVTIYRLNRFGDLLWSRKMGDPKDEFATDIKQTQDGGFIIVGSTYSSPIDTAYSDVFAMKVDDQGFILWTQSYGGSDYDEAQSVLPTADGGFLIIGSTMSYGTVFKSALAIKIDANGVQQWANIYAMTNSNYFYRGIIASDNNYVLVGGTYNINGGTNFDHYVVKINPSGTLIWAKRYGTPGPDFAYDVAETNDHGYVVAGVTSTNTAGGADQNIFKIDGVGNLIWTKNYGSPQYDRPSKILQDQNGNYFICGYTNISTTTTTINQMTLHKIDPAGNSLWVNRYGDISGTSEGLYMIPGIDGGIIMCGYSIAFSDPYGDAYVVKTDDNGASGCFQSALNFTQNNATFTDSSGSNVSAVIVDEYPLQPPGNYYVNQFAQLCFFDNVAALVSLNEINIFPNPATNQITIEKSGDDIAVATISDNLGKVVKVIICSSDQTTVRLDNISAGVYNLKIGEQSKLLVIVR